MGKFTGKLLVSDMDATLLNSRHMVSERNREAIEYFISEGGRFTVATGRMVPAVRAYFAQMSINAPALLHNGAKIYDFEKDEALFEKFIEEPRKNAIRRVHDELPEIGLEVYADERVYIYRECSETDRFKTRSYDVTYSLPDEIWHRPWIKALLIGDRELLDKYEPIYRRDYDSGYCVRSGSMYLDVVANGVSKGKALTELAGRLGIDRENIYAVGDNMNDVDMLMAAGNSFAVENAEEAVKTAADRIVPSCENSAVAYIIENLIS